MHPRRHKSRSNSAPPKAHAVVSTQGRSMCCNFAPVYGLNLTTHPPWQKATQSMPVLSIVIPSGEPLYPSAAVSTATEASLIPPVLISYLKL